MRISKELLSKVLRKEVTQIGGENSIVRYHRVEYVGMDNHRQVRADGNINIYELAHICKEWADKEAVNSFKSWKGDDVWHSEFTYGFEFIEFDGDTEPEAIFRACEWMLILKASTNEKD